MADEPQSTETEQPDNDATVAYQPPANVVTVYDSDGREHFAAPSSKFVVDGLADGSLSEKPPAKIEEAPDGGSETGSGGDGPEFGTVDGGDGSGDGSPEAGGSGRRRRTGTA
jgi:hypothetical protein